MAWIGGDRALDQQEMENNSTIVAQYFLSLKWSRNAIAGMLANMQAESTVNPQRWQIGHSGNIDYGFGLTQWTPAEKLITWCIQTGRDYINGDDQLARIKWEFDNNQQYYPTKLYPHSFTAFSKSGETPEYLARAFCYNYERPTDIETAADVRAGYAPFWFQFVGGISPGPTGNSMPWIFWMKKRRF